LLLDTVPNHIEQNVLAQLYQVINDPNW
jgi:hypothetical protein